MICPSCKSQNHKVIDTKPGESSRAIAPIRLTENCVRRRRLCINCGARWTTIEEIEERRKK